MCLQPTSEDAECLWRSDAGWQAVPDARSFPWCPWFIVLSHCLIVCLSFPPALHNIHTPVAWYSLFVLKEPLNTSKPNQTKPYYSDVILVLHCIRNTYLAFICAHMLCDFFSACLQLCALTYCMESLLARAVSVSSWMIVCVDSWWWRMLMPMTVNYSSQFFVWHVFHGHHWLHWLGSGLLWVKFCELLEQNFTRWKSPLLMLRFLLHLGKILITNWDWCKKSAREKLF